MFRVNDGEVGLVVNDIPLPRLQIDARSIREMGGDGDFRYKKHRG